MKPPKLFISFSGTLASLAAGTVLVQELRNGLFVFGCTRDYFFGNGSAEKHRELVVRENPELYGVLQDAIIKAETEGRVRWIVTYSSYELISDLLVANGFEPLAVAADAFGFNYPAVQQYSKQLQVVWRI
ncbi:MAG: hypothetical protein BWY75_01442 [bacterium ADurb.Bin425]|nr:MAG: hypothetical protein BWY75_01442 [bacterium ADurb.Bin425]